MKTILSVTTAARIAAKGASLPVWPRRFPGMAATHLADDLVESRDQCAGGRKRRSRTALLDHRESVDCGEHLRAIGGQLRLDSAGLDVRRSRGTSGPNRASPAVMPVAAEMLVVIVVVPPGGTGTIIALQFSETPPEDYPRLHFDLHVASAAEQEAEADRLTSLGAVRVDWDRYPDDPDFIVLADTEGNRFCIVDLGHESRESRSPARPAPEDPASAGLGGTSAAACCPRPARRRSG